jgi:hypothetical protein
MLSTNAKQASSENVLRTLARNRATTLFLAGAFVVCTAVAVYAAPAGDATSPVPVIVELFTSEGCSSCPPADAFLKRLDALQPVKGVEVIGVEEHVDYWNQDGWVDPYSALEWTSRQQEYVAKFKDKSPYTPQLIVDGDKEIVNPSPASVVSAIQQAAQQMSVQVFLQPGAAAGDDAQEFGVRAASVAGAPEEGKADVWLAVTEQGLGMDVTAGENKGRTLQHAAIVRSIEKIGSISSKDKSPFTAEYRVKFKSNWKRPNVQVVVFVQDHKTMRIVGAAAAKASS